MNNLTTKQLGVSGTGRKSIYTLFKELTSVQDKDEFINTLRHNRVPEEDREYQEENKE
jgi:hypothetical protein